MKLSELIKILNDIHVNQGDMEVFWGREGHGWRFGETSTHGREGQFADKP